MPHVIVVKNASCRPYHRRFRKWTPCEAKARREIVEIVVHKLRRDSLAGFEDAIAVLNPHGLLVDLLENAAVEIPPQTIVKSEPRSYVPIILHIPRNLGFARIS